MLRSTKVIAGAAIVGAVAVGGSAFTASNSLPDSQIGYGESSVSGATISSIHYTVDPTDASKLAAVVFTAVNQFANSGGSVVDPVASLTLKNSGTLVESDSCATFTASSVTTFTCNVVGTPQIDSFNQTGLTVVGP